MADPTSWTFAWGLGLALFRRGDRILAGHTGGMPGFVAILSYAPKERIGSTVLMSSGSPTGTELTGLLLTEKALELLEPESEPWRPEEAVPDDLRGILGRWWSEGYEFVFSYRGGKLQARIAIAPPTVPPAVFEPAGDGVYRTASGRERGELLRVVRDEQGEVVKLYWATYPFTRAPQVFGA